MTPELVNFLSTFVPGLIGFLLTIMVLSYLIGDNALFRIAVYIFVGVSAGYVALVAFYQVLWPQLLLPLFKFSWPAWILLLIPFLLTLLMLLKAFPRLSWIGGPAMAYLVGVGAAVAVGGAILGTILPQVNAASESFNLANSFDVILYGVVTMVATIATLIYFHFGARRQPDGSAKRNAVIEVFAWVGRLFVALTLGALFAGVYAAALTALIERVHSLLDFIFSFLS